MAQAASDSWVPNAFGNTGWRKGTRPEETEGPASPDRPEEAEMTVHLHRVSAVLFYLLGASFFLAYLMMNNGIATWGEIGSWWLTVGDLPLIVAAMLYGGSSLYLSVKPEGADSPTLAAFVVIPLVLIFGFLVFLNFSVLL